MSNPLAYRSQISHQITLTAANRKRLISAGGLEISFEIGTIGFLKGTGVLLFNGVSVRLLGADDYGVNWVSMEHAVQGKSSGKKEEDKQGFKHFFH